MSNEDQNNRVKLAVREALAILLSNADELQEAFDDVGYTQGANHPLRISTGKGKPAKISPNARPKVQTKEMALHLLGPHTTYEGECVVDLIHELFQQIENSKHADCKSVYELAFSMKDEI